MSAVRITPEADGLRLATADGAASLRLVPRLGLDLPRYHFHVGRVVHAARELGLFQVQTTLLLGNDLTGQAELTDLQLAPGAGAEALAALLAAAQQHQREAAAPGADWLVAELPGWRTAEGASPVWQALGARFYGGDPAEAEARLGPAWRTHMAALLPRQTVYLSFLGAAAEQALGQPSVSVAAWATALRAAGFADTGQVRIDDGGPVLGWRCPCG